MKRSLPVMLGLAAALVIALLVAGGFLSLPTSGGDPADATPVHDPAPLKDPEPLEVAYEDEAKNKKGKKKDDKKDKDRKRIQRKKNREGAGKSGDERGQKGVGSRTSPDLKDRNPAGQKGGVKPRPPKNGDRKNQPPRDPDPVVVSDLRGDPEGEGSAPSYMDLEGVQLRATGDVFVAQLTFAGRIPESMPSDQQATLTSLEVRKGNGDKVSVYAEASDDGWRAHTNKSSEFPGSMSIDGRTITFTVPRSFFGERFGFYAYSSWTKSTVTNTEYFFDFAPDDQNGRFPSGGTT